MLRAGLLCGIAEEIDDEARVAALHHVTCIAVWLDLWGEPRPSYPSPRYLLLRQPKALPDEIHALKANPGVRAQALRRTDPRPHG